MFQKESSVRLQDISEVMFVELPLRKLLTKHSLTLSGHKQLMWQFRYTFNVYILEVQRCRRYVLIISQYIKVLLELWRKTWKHDYVEQEGRTSKYSWRETPFSGTRESVSSTLMCNM